MVDWVGKRAVGLAEETNDVRGTGELLRVVRKIIERTEGI